MTNAMIIKNLDDIERAANAMSASGYFADASQAAQAVVKILAGQELGFGPFASMTGVYIIQGRPSFSANLMAAAVKRSGRYNYRVRELTDAACAIEFFEGGESIGISRFTADDARRAGTKNLEKFPRNMLFARAMSNGVRWYTPDIFGGSVAYTPDELGADVTEDGDVIPGAWLQPEEPEPQFDLQTAWKSEKISYEAAASVKNKDGIPYTDIPPEKLPYMRAQINRRIEKNDLTPEELDELKLKIDVIDAILQARGG